MGLESGQSELYSPGLSDWLKDGHMTQVNPIRVCPWTLAESNIPSFPLRLLNWLNVGLQLLVAIVRGACLKIKPEEMNKSLKDGVKKEKRDGQGKQNISLSKALISLAPCYTFSAKCHLQDQV